MESVCVFCGSSPGKRRSYARAAEHLGEVLAGRGLALVYGGSKNGLMGSVADAVMAGGGRVFGYLPDFLSGREVGHHGLTELNVVASMHERKAKMAARADAFIALPGGYGTLDELFEILTWAQIGLHGKPCGLLDVEGFFDPLLAYLDHACAEELLRCEHREMLLVDDDPARLLDRLASYVAPTAPKWGLASKG